MAFLRGLYLLVTLLLPLSAVSQLTWTRINDTSSSVWPAVRWGYAMEYDSFSDSIYLYGGSGSDFKTYRFDVPSRTWHVVHDTNDTSTIPPGLFYAYTGMLRFGGDGDTGESLFVVSHGFLSPVEYGETWVFNTRTNSWTKIDTTGDVPSIRYGGHYGVFNNTNEMWFGGGFTKTTSPWTRYIDTYLLRFSSQTAAAWTRIHDQPSAGNQFDPLAPHGRCLQGSSIVEQDKMVIWGGCMRGGNGGGPCPTDDSWYYNKDDSTWTELPRCSTPRVWTAMAPLTQSPGKALMYGGSHTWSGQIISAEDWPEDEVFVVDVNENTWTRYRAVAAEDGEFPERRFNHKMVATKDGSRFIFGGKSENDGSGLNDMWMLTGDPSDTDTMACAGGWVSIPHIHGLFMAVAFGLLFPSGFFVARYTKCKGEGKVSKIWFICHVIIQLSAVTLTIPAFVIIFYAGASAEPTHPHAIIGIIVMFLMVLQPVNGILRPHIRKDKTKSVYRVIWEWFHRIYGITVILFGFVQVSLGVFLIVPPQAVWIVWILLMFTWIVSFTVLEVIKCLRTLLCPSDPDGSDGMEMK